MKKQSLYALTALLCWTGASAENRTLWQTGQEALEGDGFVKEAYSTGLIVSPEAFNGLQAGTRLYIDVKTSGWAELYLKNYDKKQIYPSTAINNGVATQVLTNFQLEQILDGGLRIDASSGLEITKVWVDTEAYSGNFENALWIGEQIFSADWGGIVAICPLEASEIIAGKVLKVYYTKNAESTSVMVNYINENGKQTDYYPTWTYDEEGAWFTVEDDFAELLSTCNMGFVVKGASITVSQVDLTNSVTSLVETTAIDSSDGCIDIFNAAGVLIHRQVELDEVLPSLPAGFYIAGSKKLIVR